MRPGAAPANASLGIVLFDEPTTLGRITFLLVLAVSR
jgi:hypothetical protein